MVEPDIPPEWYQRPNIARIYDYWLDGSQNFPVDREVADRMDAAHPYIRPGVLSNRLFLRRVVAFLATQGITQFLDIGTGLPTGGNIHTTALAIQPQARIVYVDNDPLVVRLSRLLLKEEYIDKQALVIVGDVTEPKTFLEDASLNELLDFEQPIAVLCLGLLYFVTDDEHVKRILHTIRDRIAPGSYLAISHLDFEALSDGSAEEAQRIYENAVTRIQPRTIAQTEALLSDFERVDPGIVYVPAWKPARQEQVDPYAHNPSHSSMIGGIVRKAS